jgi:hypothetical protein
MILCGLNWLGGLDSNQDNQIQSLMYYQLYDLPAVGKRRGVARRQVTLLANGCVRQLRPMSGTSLPGQRFFRRLRTESTLECGPSTF